MDRQKIRNWAVPPDEVRGWVREGMEKYNVSERQLCDALGVNRSTLRHALESGESVTSKQQDVLLKAFDFLEAKNVSQRKYRIPGQLAVLGTIPAGNLSLSEENTDVDEWIEGGRYDPASHFALRIRGNSMIPQIQDGDLVILRRVEFAMGPKDEGPTPPEALARWSGRIVAVCVNDEVSIKRLEISKGSNSSYHVILRALNPDFPSRTLDATDTFRIQGELVRIIRDV